MLDKKLIEKERNYLMGLKVDVGKEIRKLSKAIPQDVSLRAAKCGNTYQFFIREASTDRNGRYIKKDQLNIARELAQYEYNKKLLLEIEKRISVLDKLFVCFEENIFESAMNKISEGKKALVSLPLVDDEVFILDWLKQDYEKLCFSTDYPEYYTRRGLRVRSKSEVIIADILDELEIPFLYEKPLKLKSGIIHPDFTLLNIKNRKEVYWEHFGMMDDIEYRNNAFYKIRQYESSGLYQYDSVIWTFETARNPINTKEVRNMVTRLKKIIG